MADTKFSKRFMGRGYVFTYEDLREMASLIDKEVGPQGEKDYSWQSRFVVRGREWDCSAESPGQLTDVNIPQTITSVAFARSGNGRDAEMTIWVGAGQQGVTLEVSSCDRDWVTGIHERIRTFLSRRAKWWGFLHAPWMIGIRWALTPAALGLLCLLIAKHATDRFFWLITAYVSGNILGFVTLSVTDQLFPNVEITSKPEAGKVYMRGIFGAVILGLVTSALWVAIEALMH